MFEVGKKYKHNAGSCLSVLGKMNTTMWGETLIAETTNGSGLMAVGEDESAMVNWTEITDKEWMLNFS